MRIAALTNRNNEGDRSQTDYSAPSRKRFRVRAPVDVFHRYLSRVVLRALIRGLCRSFLQCGCYSFDVVLVHVQMKWDT